MLAAYGDRGLHEAFLLYSRQHDRFAAHLFFTNDDALARATDAGLVPRIAELARQSLTAAAAAAGRGNPDALDLRVELDTDANVQAQYGGDYFERLY